MAEASPDFYGFLTGDSSVTSLLGTDGNSPLGYSVFPLVLKEGAELPALTYQGISLTEEHRIEDGKSSGLNDMRLQIDCWANNYPDVEALSIAVRDLFDGFQGYMGSSYVNVTTHGNLIDEFEPSRRQFRRIMDFQIIFNDV